jgi:hypothetical protein
MEDYVFEFQSWSIGKSLNNWKSHVTGSAHWHSAARQFKMGRGPNGRARSGCCRQTRSLAVLPCADRHPPHKPPQPRVSQCATSPLRGFDEKAKSICLTAPHHWALTTPLHWATPKVPLLLQPPSAMEHPCFGCGLPGQDGPLAGPG